MYEQKPGQGALFKNKKKGENEKAPDYTGSINIEGTTYDLAAWIKKTEGKPPFMSISAKIKDGAPKAKEPPPFDESDEIPF